MYGYSANHTSLSDGLHYVTPVCLHASPQHDGAFLAEVPAPVEHELQSLIDRLHDEYKTLSDGEVATYIPE
jgi:hypothetical protein